MKNKKGEYFVWFLLFLLAYMFSYNIVIYFTEKSNWYSFVIGAVVAGWSLYIKIKEDL